MFERFVTWFSVEFATELKGSEIRRELVFRDSSMGRELPSHQRRVALAAVDVHLAISVFTIAVDDVLAGE